MFNIEKVFEFVNYNSKNGIWEHDTDYSSNDKEVFLSYFSNDSDNYDVYIVLENTNDFLNFEKCIMKVDLNKIEIKSIEDLEKNIKKYRL